MIRIMIKTAALFLVAAALLGLCALAWHFVSPLTAIVLALIFAGVAWLVFTWYFADDEPLFGGSSENRVTFKQVLAGAITDARELFDRVTNMVGVALISLDAVIVSTPELKAAVLASPYGLPAILALNLVAAMTPRRLGAA